MQPTFCLTGVLSGTRISPDLPEDGTAWPSKLWMSVRAGIQGSERLPAVPYQNIHDRLGA